MAKNSEVYKTAQERAEAFVKWCYEATSYTGDCNGCPLKIMGHGGPNCRFHWLDLEAEDEKPLPCPFCGSGETKVIGSNAFHSKKVICESCKAEGSAKDSTKQAVEAWNTVVKFFMKGKK